MKKKLQYLLLMLGMLIMAAPMSVSAEEIEVVTETFDPFLEEMVKPNARAITPSPNGTEYDYATGYGGQLNDIQKDMYDALVEKYLNDSISSTFTGNLTYSFGSDRPVYESWEAFGHDIRYAYWAFVYDHPQVFWAGAVSYSIYGSTTNGQCVPARVEFTLNEKYPDAKSLVEEYNTNIVDTVEEIYTSVTDRTLEYDYYKEIHDWLCEHVSYNYDALTDQKGNPQAFSSGPIFAGDAKVTCQGYGEAFKALCSIMNNTYSDDKNGADNLYAAEIVGVTEDGMAHMWNYAYMPDGNWYGMDVLWDDQDVLHYTYFLAGSKSPGYNLTFSEEHIEQHTFSTDSSIVFDYPDIEEYAYELPEEVTPDAELAFSSAFLTLQDNIAIGFKSNASLFETTGYENPYVVFSLNGEQTIVTDYTNDGKAYIFNFDNIAPHQMNDMVIATLYADFKGGEYVSSPIGYGVSSYCYNMLGRVTGDYYAEYRTLLVDLLNYGSASQEYVGYKTDNLANAKLTDEQKADGTSETREYKDMLDTAYEVVENPAATWKAAGLNLKDRVEIRLKFIADDVENLVVKARTDNGDEWVIEASDFEPIEGGGYYVYFNKFNAGQMSENVYFTVCDGDKEVSNTLRYSIESYASSTVKKAEQNDAYTALAELLKAMMKYGDAAYNYVN